VTLQLREAAGKDIVVGEEPARQAALVVGWSAWCVVVCDCDSGAGSEVLEPEDGGVGPEVMVDEVLEFLGEGAEGWGWGGLHVAGNESERV